MLVAAAVRQLDDAQSVAAELEPHRLGVDRDRAGAEHSGREIFFVEMNRHWSDLGASA
jgi:hypothetical protein